MRFAKGPEKYQHLGAASGSRFILYPQAISALSGILDHENHYRLPLYRDGCPGPQLLETIFEGYSSGRSCYI